MDKNISQNVSGKYGQTLFNSADALKIDLKRAIQKTAEATAYFIGYKIADKVTKV